MSEPAASTAVAPTLPFGVRDAAPAFPWAGALLLLLLLGIAAWAWLTAARRGQLPRGSWLARATGALGSASTDASAPMLRSSVRLDASARLHVVEWHGRQVLLAINGATAPVVLAERTLVEPVQGAGP